MRRLLLTVPVLLAACVERSPEQRDAAEGRFCQTELSIAEQSHRFVDILFVLGDDRFAAELPRLIEQLQVSSYPAMHIAVVSSDGGDGADLHEASRAVDPRVL